MNPQIPYSLPKWPPVKKAIPREYEPIKRTPVANRMKNFQHNSPVPRTVAPTSVSQRKQQSPIRSRKATPGPSARVSSSPEHEVEVEVELQTGSGFAGDEATSTDAPEPEEPGTPEEYEAENKGGPIVMIHAVEDDEEGYSQRASSLPEPESPNSRTGLLPPPVGFRTERTAEEEEEELFNRWATEPALDAVTNLRMTLYPGTQRDRKDNQAGDDTQGGVYEDHIYDPEELYNRLDRVHASHGGGDGDGYTIDQIISYEEDEQERLERMIWTAGAVVVVLIAILLLAWGLGWKLPFRLWPWGKKSTYTYTPRKMPSLPPRPKVASKGFGGVTGMAGNLFTALGFGYVAKKVVGEKSTWQKIKGGKFGTKDLKGMVGGAGVFGKKKKGWW
ncbi:hypothetical protein TWF281_002706 [Arthrobotrys megalospora]